MSNAVYLGSNRKGNTLYLRNSIYTNGAAWGVGLVSGAVIASGRAYGTATVSGQARIVLPVDGTAAGTATVRGDAYPTGTAHGTSTVSGEAVGTTRFAPRKVLPGYTNTPTTISIPIADLIGLTAAEADVVTGDWREILQAILLRAVEYHGSFVWSDQPRTYEPFGMNLLNSRTFDRHFLIHFYTDMGTPKVAPEP
jgi:hypothetical protein